MVLYILFLIFSWFPWLIPIYWTIYLFEPMSSLSYIQLLVVESSEKLHLVLNMGASFTVSLVCILQLAPQIKVNKRADHLAAQCRRNKLINDLDLTLDTLYYTIAVSQKCKFAHPCYHMLLTANAGILYINIYRQEEAADNDDNSNCPVSHMLHIIIHFSVLSLIFHCLLSTCSCYYKESVRFCLQRYFHSKEHLQTFTIPSSFSWYPWISTICSTPVQQ